MIGRVHQGWPPFHLCRRGAAAQNTPHTNPSRLVLDVRKGYCWTVSSMVHPPFCLLPQNRTVRATEFREQLVGQSTSLRAQNARDPQSKNRDAHGNAIRNSILLSLSAQEAEEMSPSWNSCSCHCVSCYARHGSRSASRISSNSGTGIGAECYGRQENRGSGAGR